MRKKSAERTNSTENIVDYNAGIPDDSWSSKFKRAGIELCVFSRGIRALDSKAYSYIIDIREGLRKGLIDITELGISKAKKSKALNQLDESGMSVLHHATRYNRIEAVRELLESGAEVNITSVDDRLTPLHISSRFGWSEITKTLLEYGADPTVQNENGSTPLHQACKRGNKQVVSLLLEADNIGVNLKDKSRMTPLHMAAIQGDDKICAMLMTKGADYREQAADMMTPLHVAVAYGNNKAASKILKKALTENSDLGFIAHAQDIDSNSILHLASLTNNLEIAKAILEHGASVNTSTSNLSTPLHLACIKGHGEMVKLLIDKEADIEAKDNEGRTPLHICALFNQTKIISHLLDNGADIESRDFNNRTPLLAAVAAGQKDSGLILISRGADISSYDSSMKNCVHLAVKNENILTLGSILEIEGCLENLNKPDISERVPLHYAAMSKDIKVLQTILSKHERFAFHDENQKTPLHLACESGRAEHAEALAHASSSINDRNDEGKTALHIAAAFGHRKVCSKLMRLGADVNIRDNNRWTPLMCAAKRGSCKTCIDLLDNKASIDDVNNEGNSALFIATGGGHVSVVKLLLDCWANVTHRNNEGNSFVDVAAKHGVQEVMVEVCQHDRWREVIEIKDNQGHPAMKLLVQHFPAAAKLVMNHCVQKAKHMNQSDPAYTVTYDFSLLDPGPDDPAAVNGHRYFGPLTMIEHNRQQLLEHPLTQEMLDYKWHSFGRQIFRFNFLLYNIFTCCFTIFVITERRKLTFLKNGNTTVDESNAYKGNTNFIRLFSYLVMLFAIGQIIKEVIQIFLQGRNYFKEISNLLEWGLYANAVLFMFPYIMPKTTLADMHLGELTQPRYVWVTGVISIFLCYVNLVLFTRRFSITGIYVTMFLEVNKTIVKVMMVFAFFVFAFALVFYITFKEQIQFQSVQFSLTTVMAMMVGDLQYVDTFIIPSSKENPLSIVAFGFFIVFLLSMSLALMNLLIGLAIGDIDYIQRDAVLKRLAMQVEFVAQIEDKYPRFITRRYYRPIIVKYPNKRTLRMRIRKLFSMKVSAEKTTTEDTEDVKDHTMFVYTKLKKTQKQVKSLVQVIETQNQLLKALAKKIDPSFEIMSLSEEDLVQTNDMNVEEQQDEVEDAVGSHGNDNSLDLTNASHVNRSSGRECYLLPGSIPSPPGFC